MTNRARRGAAMLTCALLAAALAACGNSGGGKATTASTVASSTVAATGTGAVTGAAAPAETTGAAPAIAAGLAAPTVAALDKLAADVATHTMVPCNPTGLADCVATETEDLAGAATALQQALQLARTTVPAGPCASGLDHAIAWRKAQLTRLATMRQLSHAPASTTRDQQIGTAVQAEFDAQSTELDWATSDAGTPWQVTCDPAAAGGRLSQAGYDAVTASRAGVDTTGIKACNGTWPKVGKCIARQMDRAVPILARYRDGATAAASAVAPGRCQAALNYVAQVRADQVKRYQRIGALARKLRTDQQGAAVNALIDRMNAASIVNVNNQLAQPALLWQAACKPI